MARNTITDGPSNWHLMLAFFDPTGGSGRRRTLSFKLKNGFNLSVDLHGHRQPAWHESPIDPWTLTGHSTSMPHGYYYSRDRELVIHYDPIRRNGWIDIELISSCCGAPVMERTRADRGGLIRACSQCRQNVLRTDADGRWYWTSEEITRQNGGQTDYLRVFADPDQ